MSIKMIMTKLGLDSHYRGAIIVSRYLCTRGIEVAYLGNLLPEQIVDAAGRERADVLGISSMSNNHMTMIPPVLEGLREAGAGRVVVAVGGVIPEKDVEALRAAGVDCFFGPGASLADIGDRIIGAVNDSRQSDVIAK